MNITIYLILIALIFIVYISFNKRILDNLNIISTNLRDFITNQDSLLSIIFLGIFFLEQSLLIYFSYIYRENMIFLQIIIGGFALLVLSTASLEKILFSVRTKFFKEQLIGYKKLYFWTNNLLREYYKLKKLKKK